MQLNESAGHIRNKSAKSQMWIYSAEMGMPFLYKGTLITAKIKSDNSIWLDLPFGDIKTIDEMKKILFKCLLLFIILMDSLRYNLLPIIKAST